MKKSGAALFVVFAVAALITLGCTMTVNPQDLGTIGNAGNLSGSPAPDNIFLDMAEVAKHSTASDCWVAIAGEVLDLSSFTSHPGGSNYVPYCGKDGTAAYNDIRHSGYADALMSQYLVGVLGQPINVSQAGNYSATAGVNLTSNNSTNNAPIPPAGNQSANATSTQNTTIALTSAEVAKHNSASDCWTIINGKVLDLSSFTSHPGGSNYVPYCGKDGTAAYNSISHSSYADALMNSYAIGTLGQSVDSGALANSTAVVPTPRQDDWEEDD